MITLNKITPFNGFYENKDLGQQNNYAWSMAELDDYIYVGTGRNIVYSVAVGVFNLPPNLVPKAFIPKPFPDFNAEIWRYKKDSSEPWQRVYQSTNQDINGFRFMIDYTLASGQRILVAAGGDFTNIKMLVSEDGLVWTPANNGITDGTTVRSMVVHNGKLYMGAMIGLGGSNETILYETENPTTGWNRILFGTTSSNPRGEIASMESFNNHLYIGTAPIGGFEVWRTLGDEPVEDQWKLVVDKGAGEALNQLPLSMKVFKNQLFVGTGIWFGFYSIDPNNRFVPPKGFDLIRICSNDWWEVIVGSKPIYPTNPTTNGMRNPKKPAGFGFVSNAYCWQLEEFNGQLYLGTWDWSVLIPTILFSLIDNIDYLKGLLAESDKNSQNGQYRDYDIWNIICLIKKILDLIIKFLETMGGDLWVSYYGDYWTPISLDGLGNDKNYGIRMLLPTSDRLYVGTANPYEGCEVWASEQNNNNCLY